MKDTQQFVLRTDKMSTPHYFSGAFEANFGEGICLSPLSLNAYFFDTQEEAEDAKETLGPEDFVISTVLVGGSF